MPGTSESAFVRALEDFSSSRGRVCNSIVVMSACYSHFFTHCYCSQKGNLLGYGDKSNI